MLASVFSFLFKFRPALFARGAVVFKTGWPLLAAAAVVAAGLILWTYARTGSLPRRSRAVFVGLRLGALGLILFILGRPTLVVPTVVPQQNYLAVLVDNSRSMRIADGGQETRAEEVARLLGPEGENLLGRLAADFKLRLYGFASSARGVRTLDELDYTGARTEVGTALDRVRQDLSGVPFAGIVMLTDGADNAEGALNESVLGLKAAHVPVYAVGLGQERVGPDIEVSRVEVPHAAPKGSAIMADVLLVQSGYRGRTVRLNVEDGSQIVATQDVALGEDGEIVTARVPFTLPDAGARRIRFTVPALADERVRENNTRETLVEVDARRHKVLYFEGEPRFEMKFIRRAVEGDDNLQLVVLQQTAENKFLRLDVDSAGELAGGFPKTRAELFRYRGLMLGSVAASDFTHDQLQMIADFVRDRGGGLLLLGGRRALSEGGYAETPLADALPVQLATSRDTSGFFASLEVRPTPAGKIHPALQLAATPAATAERWRTLPPLSTVNRLRETKPGATVLLTASLGEAGGSEPVLSFERYGRGMSIVFGVQDSWMWQMAAEMPVEDLTFETLWRQLLRWLVGATPDAIVVDAAPERVEPGQVVTLTARAADSTYLAVNGATVVAEITAPSGQTRSLPLEWTVQRDGEYRAEVRLDERGVHSVHVVATRNGRPLGEATGHVEAGSLSTEYFAAGMRRALLERIAAETGGGFYTPASAERLLEDVRHTESGSTVLEEHEMWDMPIVLLLIVSLVGGEWVLRRRQGLV